MLKESYIFSDMNLYPFVELDYVKQSLYTAQVYI